MAPDARTAEMRQAAACGTQTNLDSKSDANLKPENPVPRGPPAWWADWVKVKRAKVRTAGQAYEPSEAAVYAACHSEELPPICAQSTFIFGSVAEGQARFSGAAFDHERPFARVYTRLGNPTTEALERVILELECGYVTRRKYSVGESDSDDEEGCAPPLSSLITASGMGAISSVLMSLLGANDHIICGTVYGCTNSLMHKLSAQFGVTVHLVNASNLREISDLLDLHGSKIRAVYVESIENPTMQVTDIAGISALTEPRGVPLVVDNTFATPYNTQPFRLGADIVVHSTTKYMNGHSTAIGGAIVGPTGFVMADCFGWYKDLGSTPSAFDCWVNLQNIQDLPLRVASQAAAAKELAEFLENHPRVDRVKYPTLGSHPQHELASKQMRTGGGMISFEVRGGYDAAVRLMDYFATPHHDAPATVAPVHLCVSLGAVTTYIQHPASMTHKCVPQDERLAMGITDTLIRVSVGIDGGQALRATFERALAAACDSVEQVSGA